MTEDSVFRSSRIGSGVAVLYFLGEPSVPWKANLVLSIPQTVRLVEQWFALLSQRQIKRGSHYSVRELEAAISEFVALHNQQPKPFVWTKTADTILSSIGRFASRTLAEHGANNM